MDYLIITDSGCDISPKTLKSWGVQCIDLSFRKADSPRDCYNRDIVMTEFYDEMRAGTVFQTSAVNTAEYTDVFSKALQQGLNVLYICFSSGLSACRNSADLAAAELASEYPKNKVAVIDSLCGSAGLGLLVYLAVQKKKGGADFSSLIKYIEETIPRISHWFTVDDLKYLKRGGRVSPSAAFAATVLDIKPILHVDDEGHLVPVTKVRGRRAAIKALAEKYQLLAEDPEAPYFISHGDCLEDALLLESMIHAKSKNKAASITDIGPVVGSHAGPGTLALFFAGRKR
ncbi:MAG: DegV family protein [Clostridia bacterium]|nr:DegV family protein [Clostridia bacterium]